SLDASEQARIQTEQRLTQAVELAADYEKASLERDSALAELDEVRASQTKDRTRITELQARLGEANQQVSRMQAALAEASEGNDTAAAATAELGAEREARRGDQEKLAKAQEALHEAEQRAKALARELDEARAALAAAERERDELRTRLEQAVAEAGAASGDAGTGTDPAEVASLKAALKDANTQIAALNEQIDMATAASASGGGKNANARAQLEKAMARIAALETEKREREPARQEALEKAAALEEEIKRLTVAAAGLEHELSQARATIDAMAGKGDQAAEIARLSQELTVARDELAMTRERLAAFEGGEAPSGEQAGAMRETMDRQAREIAALKERIEEIKAAAPRGDAWNENRRRRLKKAKSLIGVQSGKIRKASQALADRFDACEKLLSQRGELAKAARAIESSQNAIAGERRFSRVVFSLVACLALLGGVGALSWMLAEEFAPATYAASASLRAEGRRELSAAERAEWQRFIEERLTHPAFIEMAAERMKRRGIVSLGEAGPLSSHLTATMSFDSNADGQLKIEMRGPGRLATERVLDTYVTALVSDANANRMTSVIGAVTVVGEEAHAPREPLESDRMMYAAIGSGGGIVLVGILGFVMWSRLARGMEKFEEQTRLAFLLDDARWANPSEQSQR
ncbi:MAG: hypothetical protein R3B68_03055, partial [Phycisphaerales bacterium]